MVGFLRKKKSDRAVLSGDTVLDRKGKVDGTSLLDNDGEPTEGSLFDVNGKRVGHNQRNSDEENRLKLANNPSFPPVMATGLFPPQHSGHIDQQQPGVHGYDKNQPHQYGQVQHPTQRYGQPPQQYGQPPQQYGQPQQQFGLPPQQYPPTTLGGQYQYPVRYGQMPPPMPSAASKKPRFRIPGMGKKN